MNNLYQIIYFILLGSSIYSKNVSLILITLLAGIAILALIPVYKKARKQNIKNGNVILNINKASWWEFEELPCFQRVSAKKAVWMRKHNGKYSSKEDFYLKNNIENKEEIEKLICL